MASGNRFLCRFHLLCGQVDVSAGNKTNCWKVLRLAMWVWVKISHQDMDPRMPVLSIYQGNPFGVTLSYFMFERPPLFLGLPCSFVWGCPMFWGLPIFGGELPFFWGGGYSFFYRHTHFKQVFVGKASSLVFSAIGD